MIWPFKREKRQAQGGGAYTSALVAQIVAQASSGSPDPGATAALEFAAGTWARAFASAEIKPAFPQITPAMLACIGRELVRSGEVLFSIAVRSGQISLCSGWFMGRSRRTQIRLQLVLSHRHIRAFKFADVRFSCLALRSCTSVMGVIRLGPGPGYLRLDYAYLTGIVSWFGLELRLSQEAQARVGYLLPVSGQTAATAQTMIRISG